MILRKNNYFSVEGIYFDIANSMLSKRDKNYLIAAVDKFVYQNIPFPIHARHLLWRIRKKYHIVLTGLCAFAEPRSIIEKLLF